MPRIKTFIQRSEVVIQESLCVEVIKKTKVLKYETPPVEFKNLHANSHRTRRKPSATTIKHTSSKLPPVRSRYPDHTSLHPFYKTQTRALTCTKLGQYRAASIILNHKSWDDESKNAVDLLHYETHQHHQPEHAMPLGNNRLMLKGVRCFTYVPLSQLPR